MLCAYVDLLCFYKAYDTEHSKLRQLHQLKLSHEPEQSTNQMRVVMVAVGKLPLADQNLDRNREGLPRSTYILQLEAIYKNNFRLQNSVLLSCNILRTLIKVVNYEEVTLTGSHAKSRDSIRCMLDVTAVQLLQRAIAAAR